MDWIQVCHDWEYDEFFTSEPILKITVIFNRLANYVITQAHAYREEKVMATSGEKQDENDWGSDRV